MNVVLDHCVPKFYSQVIAGLGHTPHASSSHIQFDAPDTDVIALAQELDAVLLTVDLDFANILDYPPEQYEGIVVMRYHITSEAEITSTLKLVFSELTRDEMRKALIIVSPRSYRIRK
jgi:predicted nuclease of predicted toxin-antitoxin system